VIVTLVPYTPADGLIPVAVGVIVLSYVKKQLAPLKQLATSTILPQTYNVYWPTLFAVFGPVVHVITFGVTVVSTLLILQN
jgi:hypothetical protein